jgi:hypothetical protein
LNPGLPSADTRVPERFVRAPSAALEVTEEALTKGSWAERTAGRSRKRLSAVLRCQSANMACPHQRSPAPNLCIPSFNLTLSRAASSRNKGFEGAQVHPCRAPHPHHPPVVHWTRRGPGARLAAASRVCACAACHRPPVRRCLLSQDSLSQARDPLGQSQISFKASSKADNCNAICEPLIISSASYGDNDSGKSVAATGADNDCHT